MFGRIMRAAALAALAAGPAAANARKFAFTYESAVLPKGDHEVEAWMTWRAGRDDIYSRLDQRLEFEYGVTDRLLTAFYLNWKKTSVRDPLAGELVSESEFGGVSNEWKLKLLDPVADVVGLGLYGEVTGDTDEAEVETKLLLDKAFGPVLLAYNAIGEVEWVYTHDAFIPEEKVMEHVGGLSFALSPACAFGAEARARSVYLDGALAAGAVFVGPVVHCAHEHFWITVTALFQVGAIKPSTPGAKLELGDHERVNARVLVSLPL